MTTLGYPKISVLRRGIVLRAIINAIATTEHDDYARLISWDGKNYVLNDLDGRHAAIAFDGNEVVGVFFDSDSYNNPFKRQDKYDRSRFFQGMPATLQPLADEALRFNRLTIQGKSVALVTAAFWSEGEYLRSAFPWGEVFGNGVHLIRIELIEDAELALKEWQESYQCSSERLAFSRALFERRMSQRDDVPMVLGKTEIEWVISHSENKEALADCLKALRPIGILAAT